LINLPALYVLLFRVRRNESTSIDSQRVPSEPLDPKEELPRGLLEA